MGRSPTGHFVLYDKYILAVLEVKKIKAIALQTAYSSFKIKKFQKASKKWHQNLQPSIGFDDFHAKELSMQL